MGAGSIGDARVAVLDAEPMASRAGQAIRALADETGARVVAAPVVRRPDGSGGPAAPAWRHGSDAPIGVAGDPWDVETLEGALEADRPDLLWMGWAGWDHALAVAAASERLGMATVNPGLEALRLISDTAACAVLAGVGTASRPDPSDLGVAAGEDAGGRLLEAETVADGDGAVWVLGLRDVSLRRPGAAGPLVAQTAFGLPAGLEERVAGAALGLHRNLIRRFGPAARGGLTARFVLAGEELRMAAVYPAALPWHAATEATTGLDSVSIRLAVALGGRLTGRPPTPRGHAATALIRAEDPLSGFRPGGGVIEAIRCPGGPGIRVDACGAAGDVLGAEPEPAVIGGPVAGTITAWGPDRPAALQRLRRAVAESVMVVGDAPTDRSFVVWVLEQDLPGDGEGGHALVRDLAAEGGRPAGAEVALLDAAIAAHEEVRALDQEAFYRSAERGRAEVRDEVGSSVELTLGGAAFDLRVLHVGPGRYRVHAGGPAIAVTVERLGPRERRLVTGDGAHTVVAVHEGSPHLVEVDGALHRIDRGEGQVVVAPAPAVVVEAKVEPGQEVRAGDPLVVLEAMKMEMSVTASQAGRVRWVVGSNVQVGAGEPVVRLEPEQAAAVAAYPVDLDRLASVPGESASRKGECRVVSEKLRRLVLGYDVDGAEAGDLAGRWSAVCRTMPPDDPDVVRAEDEVLGIFADMLAVAARRLPSGPEAEFMRAPADPLPLYVRTLDPGNESLPAAFVDDLRRALSHYGVGTLERTPELEDAVFLMFRSHQRTGRQVPAILAILDRRLEQVDQLREAVGSSGRDLLDRLVLAAQERHPAVADLAREVRYRFFGQPLVERAFDLSYRRVQRHLVAIALQPNADHGRRIQALVGSPMPLRAILIPSLLSAEPPADEALLESLVRRYYRIRPLRDVATSRREGRPVATAAYGYDGAEIRMFATAGDLTDLPELARTLAPVAAEAPDGHDVLTDYFLWNADAAPAEEVAGRIREALDASEPHRRIRRAVVTLGGPRRDLRAPREEHFTFRQSEAGGPFEEDPLYRGLHPMMGKRLDLWRLSNFDIERLPSVEDVYLFRAVARENPKDERLVAMAEVRDVTAVRDEAGRITHLPHLERMFTEALAGIRLYQSHRPEGRRVQWNRMLLHVRPQVDLDAAEVFGLIQRMAPLTEGMGLEKVVVRATLLDPDTGEHRERILHITNPVGRGLTLRFDVPSDRPIEPLSPYRQKVVTARQRGLVYPYEIVSMLAPGPDAAGSAFPPGEFVEHDLDDTEARLIPVDRPYGENRASIVAGVITNRTAAYPEGMKRVVILGDPTRALGSLAEAECRRINAALDLAEELGVPLEWFAVSSGARISMESGTENMDWIGRVLRRLIEYTQAGHEVNVVVCGINVGAQPYWNAEATMLMHTRGILIMTAEGAMVLTGKQALDYSGGVSADDNFGIGGYDRIMGLNGQAQYWAADVADACGILLRHYEHTYRAPGERFPRRVPTTDPFDRDVGPSPHRGESFTTVGEIFSDRTNPERKRPFDIRSVMRAVADVDHGVLERWGSMRDAETVVVWDAVIGGFPVCLLGIESRPVPRQGTIDADGPQFWTSGTLFPQSSKKAARAISAASGNRPLVVLANLSGFDGSPESMRKVQLEYGAEIGRAVTNFRGPIVFLVVSRYHGGAFVVFSQTLNESLEVAAVEGSYASVIGGAPAAAVVFAREVGGRVAADQRIVDLEAQAREADPDERIRLLAQLEKLRAAVRSEKLGEVAKEFDAVHDIHRALKMGSVHRILEAERIRPYLIDAIERGVARELAR